MGANSDKPGRWKTDISRSVDAYNDWFMRFAPETYRNTRAGATAQVRKAFLCMANLATITPAVLQDNPWVLPIVRMVTAPPIARDRLIGLAAVSANLVQTMEQRNRLPPRMDEGAIQADLGRVAELVRRLIDRDLFSWLEAGTEPSDEEVHRAATIVADRLCGAQADPIIRSEQEARQMASLEAWLAHRHYEKAGQGVTFETIKPGTYALRLNVAVRLSPGGRQVNIPVDAAIMPATGAPRDLPLLIEAKSAGDYTNTNKRRKEEAAKATQLRNTYGSRLHFVLLLCGYFDSGYLGYVAAEGVDWVWEHRLDDLAEFGV